MTLCAVTLHLAGCAIVPTMRAQGDPASQVTSAVSPAREQVRPGRAEIVLTDRHWPSFEEASKHRITAVADGSPLYLNIRTATPLGQLALPADPQGRYTFSPYPHLYLHIGEDTSLQSLYTCYITLSQEETAGRELVVPLAPIAYRPGGIPADCWLAAATSSNRATQNYEIRLAGLASRLPDWLPVADLLAIETITAEYRGGTPRYEAMLAAGPEVSASPAPAIGQELNSPEPPKAAAGIEPSGSALVAESTGVRTVPAPDATVAPVPAATVAPTVTPVPTATVAATVTPVPVANVVAVPAMPQETPLYRSLPDGAASAAGRERQSVGQARARVVIHSPAGDVGADARARSLRERLLARGEFHVDLRYVTAVVSADNIRIFHEADRDKALATRDLVADESVPIRNFSDYRPLPAEGTIELWLASTRGDSSTTVSGATRR